jgi:uncharacterized protein (TIGR01244 family)
MQAAQVTPRYAVTPQIDPSDAAAIRDAGFTDVICNRPDEEVAANVSAQAVGAALSAEGVRFHVNPVRNGGLTEVEVARQAEILAEAKGPVLAYCRSGTRSTIVWALGESGMTPDDIIAAARNAGYDLSPYRPNLGRR